MAVTIASNSNNHRGFICLIRAAVHVPFNKRRFVCNNHMAIQSIFFSFKRERKTAGMVRTSPEATVRSP